MPLGTAKKNNAVYTLDIGSTSRSSRGGAEVERAGVVCAACSERRASDKRRLSAAKKTSEPASPRLSLLRKDSFTQV